MDHDDCDLITHELPYTVTSDALPPDSRMVPIGIRRSIIRCCGVPLAF